MTATNTTRTVGIDDSTIEVGTSTTVTASAASTTPAIDDVVSGDAQATASTTAQAAILNSKIRVGTAGTLNATEVGSVGAAATTTTGDATASASNDGPTGGIINSTDGPNQIKIGTDAVVTADATNDALAAATAVDGATTATANTGKVFGLKNVGLEAGLGVRLDAAATATNTAAAQSVGLQPGTGAATATAGAGNAKVVGIYASGAKFMSPPVGDEPAPEGPAVASVNGEHGASHDTLKISFGESGIITAFGDGGFDASAESVTGAANASSLANLVAGIAVGRNTSYPTPEGEDAQA